jgi:uncharacterized membrane protein
LQSETARIEAFSDSIFGIAATLLVLNLQAPTEASGKRSSALLAQWPHYFAFAVSFVFIGIMWINHHRLFSVIRRSENTLIMLNLFLLLGVTFVPFPTAVLANYLGKPEQRAATALFNGTSFAVAILFTLLWRHSATHRLRDTEQHEAAAHMSAQYAVGPALYLVCFALTWVSVAASLVMNILLAFYFALPPRHANRLTQAHRVLRNR